MESATQSTRNPDANDAEGDRPDNLQHRPFRTWALQQDLISLLGNEPNWENGEGDLGESREHSSKARALNGQGFLRDQLQNSPEFGLGNLR